MIHALMTAAIVRWRIVGLATDVAVTMIIAGITIVGNAGGIVSMTGTVNATVAMAVMTEEGDGMIGGIDDGC